LSQGLLSLSLLRSFLWFPVPQGDTGGCTIANNIFVDGTPATHVDDFPVV
jgi:hypothetical protein